MPKKLAPFFPNERGATAIEYALIAGSIAMAIVAVVALLGGGVRGLFEGIANGFGS